MNNKLFNVNGEGIDMLKRTINLAFEQHNNATCISWRQTKKHGLILCWTSTGNKLPDELNADECIPFIEAWLNSDYAKTVELSDWCNDIVHDGSNSTGWQVYCENLAYVGEEHDAICAIKPAYLWNRK